MTNFTSSIKQRKSAGSVFTSAKYSKNLKNRVFKWLLTCFFAFIVIILAIYPQKYVASCLKGLNIWAVSVLPALLPFFFLTTLIAKTGCADNLSTIFSPIVKHLFRCPKSTAYPFVMSMLSGYPVGCKILCELYENKQLSKSECKKAISFCSTSGPLFVIGAVGVGMFNSLKTGQILFISHILSAIILGAIFSFKKTESLAIVDSQYKKTDENVLYESAYSTVVSVCVVATFIAVFFVFTDIACDFGLLKPFVFIFKRFIGENNASAFCKGLIECTQGAISLSAINNGNLSVLLTSFLISFGGLSVIFQSAVYLKKAEISVIYFILLKLLHGVISCALTAMFLFI